ncbi:MAG: 50S ribosomal protein L24 [Flavobacterium sp. SCGC AAA160-P02]|nr:MAG: 50S ribosomal protein L24 [Flavobacterium sp. SCGC AAA160-P02]
MTKFKIKVGDTVKVIAGEYRQGTDNIGKVLQIIKDKNRVIVEGINLVSKHTKPSAQSPQGGIVKKEASIHISNLALAEDGQAVKVGYRFEEGKKIRFSKKSNKAI